MKKILVATLLLCGMQEKAPSYLAIKGGTVHTDFGHTQGGAVILVKDGVIEAVGADVQIPAGAEVIELQSTQNVSAGFVDVQSHLGCVFEADEETEALTPHMRASDAYGTDRDEVRAAFSSGVTTVVLTPGESNVVGGAMSIVKLRPGYLNEVLVEPVAAMKMSLGGEALHSDRAPTSLAGAVAMLEKELGDPKSDLAVRVVKEKKPVFVHVRSAEEVARALKLRETFGLQMVLVHAEDVEDLAALLKGTGVPVVLGPLALTDSAKRLSRAAELSKAGAQVVFATDYPSTGEEGLRRTAMLAVQNGMEKNDALASITDRPAKLVGLDARVGRVAKGFDGDLVVFSGHPLSPSSAVQIVISGGRVIYRASK